MVNHMLDPTVGGGTAERTYQLAKALGKAGATVRALVLDIGDTAVQEEALGEGNVIKLPLMNRRFFIPRAGQSRIRAIVAGHDIVHLMGHWTVLNAMVYRACRRLSIPYVVCPAGALQVFGRSRRIKQLYNVLVGRMLVRLAAARVAISENELPQYAAYGVEEADIRVISNGVDTGEYLLPADGGFRARYGIPPGPFVLFMGRLNEIKGPDMLLQAYSRLPAAVHAMVKLVFAGPDGGMLSGLRIMAEELGIAHRVFFIGPVSLCDKVSVYKESAMLAIPSRREAMSIVVLEAGVCARPVLLTDSCGFSQVEESEGARVTAATVAALAAGLQAMLTDMERLPAMGSNLHRYVVDNFLWRHAAERYLALFSEVLGEPPCSPNHA